jgi:hypothetical protein
LLRSANEPTHECCRATMVDKNALEEHRWRRGYFGLVPHMLLSHQLLCCDHCHTAAITTHTAAITTAVTTAAVTPALLLTMWRLCSLLKICYCASWQMMCLLVILITNLIYRLEDGADTMRYVRQRGPCWVNLREWVAGVWLDPGCDDYWARAGLRSLWSACSCWQSD